MSAVGARPFREPAAAAAAELPPALARRRERIDDALRTHLSQGRLADVPAAIGNAARKAVLTPGKRLRPLLTLASAECCGGGEREAMHLACAIELIHVASLIYDDLPSMDDELFRRGVPSLHRTEGEALTIIVGIALVAQAFELAASVPVPGLARVISCLAGAVGGRGLCGGQILDLRLQRAGLDDATGAGAVEDIYARKTGALMAAACEAGALGAGAAGDTVDALRRFGSLLGLAFQIQDDIGDEDADRQRRRPNYSVRFGQRTARERARALLDEAAAQLDPLGDRAASLRAIAALVSPNAP